METICQSFESLLERIPSIRRQLCEVDEILLSNLVMVGEIPAPTFEEGERVRFMTDRFRECGLDNVSSDEVGNVAAILAGAEDQRNILVVAHLDTLHQESTDHTVRLNTRRIEGVGIADNSLGLAVIASLPTLLEKLDIRLKSSLILMGASRSLGHGNLEGIKFFLDHQKIPVCAGICVEGVELGRLSYSSVGMLRGEIKCALPKGKDWSAIGSGGAITLITQVIERIQKIPIPQRPATSIILGSCSAGKSFNRVAESATLRFEVRSEESGRVGEIHREIDEIVDEVRSLSGAKCTFEIIARISGGGIRFSDPLTVATRRIMEKLGLKPKVAPSVGELSALISRGIPGVTLGLTHRETLEDDTNECVLIEPLHDGLAQLIALLLAIDEGNLDEDHE